jgi:glutathione S-transferase
MTGTMLQITRVFDASPERVFDAWLSRHWADWIGPHGIRGEITELNPSVGGRYRVVMHQEGRAPYPVQGVYRVIERPHKLVFTWIWEDDWIETLVTLTFHAEGNGTTMTLRHEGFATPERCQQHQQGWTNSLENLSNSL